MKKLNALIAMCFVFSQSMLAQTTVMSDLTFQDWSDPITVYNDDNKLWTYNNSKEYRTPSLLTGESTTLYFKMHPVVKSTFDVKLYQSAQTSMANQKYIKMDIYVDDVLWKSVDSNVLYWLNPCYFIDLEPGEHTIKLVATQERTDTGKNDAAVYVYGLAKTNHQVLAEVTEPGSLGQEILFDNETDVISDVRCLKVTGTLNAADWTTLSNMRSTLWEVDLSGVTNTEIPDNQFKRNNADWQYLNKVVLPSTIKTIGSSAFYNSYITNITFPAGIDEIKSSAFYNTCLEEVNLPSSYCSNGNTYNDVFHRNVALKTFTLNGNNVINIGETYLNFCPSLTNFTLPAQILGCGKNAFYECWNNDFGSLSNVVNFGQGCFNSTKITNIDLMSAESMDRYCFSNNNYLESVSIGEKFYQFANYEDFMLCPLLTTFKLYSPTVCRYNSTFTANLRSGITLQVPNYLVNSYKSDAEWMNMGKIEGFSTEDVSLFHINKDLTLGARQRFEGNPSIELALSYNFKIGGESIQNFNEFNINSNRYDNIHNQIISACPNVHVAKAGINFYTRTTWRNYPQWFMLCLPFDTRVGDIIPQEGSYAIRYYDGAARAANGIVSGNQSWKDYDADDVIPAGTGFVYITSANTWSKFTSNGAGDKLFSNQAHTTTLVTYDAENTANKSWNLVGNPYQCYYDAKKMNFAAPITTYSVGSYGENIYTAYSLIDDDYILKPNEGFFVQAPDGVDHITFPLAGKQLDATVQTSNVKAFGTSAINKRSLVDITISNGESSDRARVVLNENASANYELSCDAGKMLGDGLQVYSIGADGTQYAINERPVDNGLVKLGVIIPSNGKFTLSLTRNNAEQVVLFDNETGDVIDMMNNSYTFDANEGTNDNRFVLKTISEATSIINVENTEINSASIFDLSGRKVSCEVKDLKSGIYLINGNKVLVK